MSVRYCGRCGRALCRNFVSVYTLMRDVLLEVCILAALNL